MPINLAPAMTALLVKAGAFSREPFTLLDIGARGGMKEHWRVFGNDFRLIGFEADPEEYRRLRQTPPTHGTIFPFGLGGRNETRTLHVLYNSSGSTLYDDDPHFMERTLLSEARRRVTDQTIELRRLDDIAAEIGNVDFLDIDTEGAELEIMEAGTSIVGCAETLGIYTEVRFLAGYTTPLYWQTDQFLRRFGYSLYDLYLGRESRRALPYPMLGDQRHEDDAAVRVFGPTVSGQLAYGDALYLRDAVGAKTALGLTKRLKLACLFEIFDQNDSAAELILAERAQVDSICDHRALLDALVPVVARTRLPYDEYVARFFAGDAMLRSAAAGEPRDLYAAAREVALLLIRGGRGRRIAGKLARMVLRGARSRG